MKKCLVSVLTVLIPHMKASNDPMFQILLHMQNTIGGVQDFQPLVLFI